MNAAEPGGMKKYYAVKVGDDRYDMRQTRYRHMDHPHDVCAAYFTGQALIDVCDQFGFDCDFSAIENDRARK